MTLPDLYAALEAAIARDDTREIAILETQMGPGGAGMRRRIIHVDPD